MVADVFAQPPPHQHKKAPYGPAKAICIEGLLIVNRRIYDSDMNNGGLRFIMCWL